MRQPLPSTRRVARRAGLASALLAGFCANVAHAEDPPPQAIRVVEACMARNLPGKSSRQSVRFRRVDRLGAARVSQAEILWRSFGDESRARVRFLAPEALRGTSVLLVRSAPEAEVLVWLPELDEVRRLRGSGLAESAFGTDFSFEDLERLVMGHGNGRARRRSDTTFDDRDVYVLESTPTRAEDTAYGRIVSFVDRRTCVPIRMDLYEHGGRLRKVMKVPAQRIERREGRWLPTLVLMKDLIEETYTELIVDDVALDLEISQTLFNEEALRGSPGGTP